MYLEKQHCYEHSIVSAESNEIVFYTYPWQLSGVIRPYTTLWEYHIPTRKLKECFTFEGAKIDIWMDEIPNQYVYTGSKSITFTVDRDILDKGGNFIGKISKHGDKLWEYRTEQYNSRVSVPFIDVRGNIYVFMNNKWLYCFDTNGNIKWKWTSDYIDYWSTKELKVIVSSNEILHIYVFDLHGFFVLTQEGNQVKHIEMPETNMSRAIKIVQDKIIYYNDVDDLVVCCNQKGECLWSYSTRKYGKVRHISLDEYNNIYFIIPDLEDMILEYKGQEGAGWLFSLDMNGKERWVIESSCVFSDYSIPINENEIILAYERNAEGYSLLGKKIWNYQQGGSIIWINALEDNLVTLSKIGGHLTVTQRSKDLDGKIHKKRILKEVNEEKESMSLVKWNDWKKELTEYIGRNIDVWLKYHITGKLSAIKIYYEVAECITLEICIDGEWYKVQYENIECSEKVTEENRDEHKECRYLDMLWIEFFEDGGEGYEDRMMKEVSKVLTDKYQVEVSYKEGRK